MQLKQKMILAVMIIVAVAMLLGCTVSTAYKTTFHVTDDEFGNVQGAAITINGATVYTDANGIAYVDLAAQAAGYAYTVSATGYPSVDGSVVIPAGGHVGEVDVSLLLDSISSSKIKTSVNNI